MAVVCVSVYLSPRSSFSKYTWAASGVDRAVPCPVTPAVWPLSWCPSRPWGVSHSPASPCPSPYRWPCACSQTPLSDHLSFSSPAEKLLLIFWLSLGSGVLLSVDELLPRGSPLAVLCCDSSLPGPGLTVLLPDVHFTTILLYSCGRWGSERVLPFPCQLVLGCEAGGHVLAPALCAAFLRWAVQIGNHIH